MTEIKEKSLTDLDNYLHENEYDRIPNFDYLTRMHCSSMTKDRVETLRQESEKCRKLLDDAIQSTPITTWIKELNELRCGIVTGSYLTSTD